MGELRAKVRKLPKRPGVYQWKDASGETLYVGKAIDLRARCSQYVQDGAHKPEMMVHAADLDWVVVGNNKEALILEQTLIKRLKPRYNVRLTDGKQYPFIKLTAGPYPRLMKVHQYIDDGSTYFGPFPDGYGAFHVMQVLNDLFPLRRCKTLPNHKCLYYDIGKCIAPCIDACTDDEYDALVEEVKKLLRGRSKGLLPELQKRVEEAAAQERFEDAARLRDQLRGLRGCLEQQHMLADRLEDRDIAALAARGDKAVMVMLHQRDGKMTDQSHYVLSGVDSDAPGAALADFLVGHYSDRTVPRHIAADVGVEEAERLEADLRLLSDHAVTVASPQRGEKARWLDVARTNAGLRLEEETLRIGKRGMGAVEALQQALGLDVPPRVIEGFDVSHQAGAHTRAAMVRFVDGEAQKEGYRTFSMNSVGETAVAAGTARSRGAGREVDDYASIAEAVGRRFRGLLERGEPLPDLVLIDGGAGQLAAARGALRDAGVPQQAVASLAKREEEVHVPGRMSALNLPRDHPGLQLLQRVRDESHRFGITQVRRKAAAAVRAGPLDAVPGIGPARRVQLVKAFGGLEGLKAATVDDLVRLPGITRGLAEMVVDALAGNQVGGHSSSQTA